MIRPAALYAAQSTFGNQLLGWLREGKFFQETMAQVYEDTPIRFGMYLYTDRHRYQVYADPGGMGCIGHARAPLPGEEHTRMSDLADGDLSERTFRLILCDILTMEALLVTTAS